MEKLGKASATTTVASTDGSSSRARRAAAIPASLPPITSSRIVTPPRVGEVPGLGAGRDKLAQELLDTGVDVVADPADDLDRLAGRVLELPVLIALARIDRAGIPTTHSDDHISGPDELVGQRLGELPGQVDAHLIHRRHHGLEFHGALSAADHLSSSIIDDGGSHA